MDNQYFVVLENSAEGPTIYPEVHYVFQDDAFAPEMDVVERKPGDISVLVDLDESGQLVQGCQSISPEWQVTDASLATQALDTASNAEHTSRLLRITGAPAKSNQDIVSFKGDFEQQIAKGQSLIAQLESRHHEIKRAIASYHDELR